MGRTPVTETINGLKVTSAPLKFELAQAMLPDAIEFVSRGIKELGTLIQYAKFDKDGKVEMTPELKAALPAIISSLKPSELRELMTIINRNSFKLLASTTVVMPDVKGDMETKTLSTPKDYEEVFEEHPQMYLPVVLLAGRVTFARFFPDLVRPGGKTPSA